MYINNFFWFKPLGNIVSKWRIQKSSCYIPPVIIRLPPFINHLKHLPINLKVLLKTKVKQFYCTKFVIATVKGFRLVRKMQECTTEFSKKNNHIVRGYVNIGLPVNIGRGVNIGCDMFLHLF